MNDVSFEIKKGETVGIIGKNGAGKSTLLKMITGVLTPTSGKIEVNGKIASLLELGAGLNPEMTGFENIYLNGTLMGFTKEEMDSKIDAILEFADIGEFIYQPVKMYSSGMFARLAFSVAINVEPEILIVDEVLSVGDVAFQVKCFEKFRNFKDAGKTILFVSHSTSQITQLCSFVYWFKDGKIHRSGVAKDVAAEYHAMMTHGATTQSNSDTDVDIQVSKTNEDLVEMSKDIAWSGEGGMRVLQIGFFDVIGKSLSTITKAQKVKLVYTFQALTYIFNPFLSFILINKNGNRILGVSNITESKQFDSIESGQNMMVTFEFDLPELANDEYIISIGLNDGTQEEHVRHQYIVDAYKINFDCKSPKQKQATLYKLSDAVIDLKSDNYE
jgi:ABC-type polysaccharide/polyol phosphate transport system ATPase subunit